MPDVFKFKDDEKTVEELSCTSANNLPMIIFLNRHDNPKLQDFLYKILPALKKCGYKKFLCEGLPPERLKIKYFDEQLATCVRDQKMVENVFRREGVLDAYNALSTGQARLAFCLDRGFPDELAGRCAELPRLSRDYTFFKDSIISKFGFRIFGTEDDTIARNLLTSDMLQSRSGINEETIRIRNKGIAQELIKHQRALQEGGAIMYLGQGHFPGVCEYLLANGVQTKDYLFIDLECNLNDHETSMVRKFLGYAKTFRLVSARLDNSQEGKPDIVAHKILSLDALAPYIAAHKPKTGTGKMMALELKAISDQSMLQNVDRETKDNLQSFLMLVNFSKKDLSLIQAMQARRKGCLSRRTIKPLLSQYTEAQKTLKAIDNQESALGDQMRSAVHTKQYDKVIDLAKQAKACQEEANATKRRVQTLKDSL